jgi:hypothetical protein
MNYNKIKAAIIRRKKYAVVASVAIIILVGSILAFKSNGKSEAITPNSNGKSSNNSYASKYSNSSAQAKSNQTTRLSQSAASANSSDQANFSADLPEYDYKDAPDHIGERAIIKGTVLKVFTAKSGVTFFDFCAKFDDCPFSAVIFASDLEKFGDVKKNERTVRISGLIKSYNGKAEVVLDDPGQVE